VPVENSVQNVHRRLWRTPRDDDATKTNGCSNVAWSSFDDFMFSRCFDVLLRMILHFVLFSANWSMTIINTKIIKICPHLLMLSSKYYGPFTRRWQTSIVIVFQGSVAASTRRGAWRIKHISWFRFRDHILRRALVTPQVILIIEPEAVCAWHIRLSAVFTICTSHYHYFATAPFQHIYIMLKRTKVLQ